MSPTRGRGRGRRAKIKRKRRSQSTAQDATASAAGPPALEFSNDYMDPATLEAHVEAATAAASAAVAAQVAARASPSPPLLTMSRKTEICSPAAVMAGLAMPPLSPSNQAMCAKDMDVIQVKQEELHMFLESIPDFRNAIMVRGGRCIKSHFVHVVKGENYLRDMFYSTESTPQRKIVIARETLYCRGRGNCLRACGGRGQCVDGCSRVSDRASGGHYCHFQVKLFMFSTSLGTWQVRIIGSHDAPKNSWSCKAELPLEKQMAEVPVTPPRQPNHVEPELLEIEPLTDPAHMWNQNNHDMNHVGSSPNMGGVGGVVGGGLTGFEPSPSDVTSIGMTVNPNPNFVLRSIPQEELHIFLNTIPSFHDAIMVRGGRFIKSEYIRVEKGTNYMLDRFYPREGAPNKNVQVARETLFCSGRGVCIRRCGGIGSCVKGCMKTSERASGGHLCFFQVKLSMYSSSVGVWRVKIQGSHDGPMGSWDKSTGRLDMMGGVEHDLLDSTGSLPGAAVDNSGMAMLPPHTDEAMETNSLKSPDCHSRIQGMLHGSGGGGGDGGSGIMGRNCGSGIMGSSSNSSGVGVGIGRSGGDDDRSGGGGGPGNGGCGAGGPPVGGYCPCDGSCQEELGNLRQENMSLKLEILRLRHADSFKLIEDVKELIRKYDRSGSRPSSPSAPKKEPAMYLMRMKNEDNTYVTLTQS